ncbi:hypothetical protein [Consotaella aegiceratis]|uniref:hypothetical protein n=1 Tax=Consotaella aegiceratis TaxID=3097961 RepID=UPI002F417C98
MSDIDRPTLAVIGSMELLSNAGLRILDRRKIAARGKEVQALQIETEGGSFWGITRSGGEQIFAHAIDYRANVDALLHLSSVKKADQAAWADSVGVMGARRAALMKAIKSQSQARSRRKL